MLKPSSEKSVLKLFELIFGKSVLVPPCPILLVSTVEVVQYSGGITSILWRVFSTVEGYLQYCGGITAVHVGDSFSTVEGIQYTGG